MESHWQDKVEECHRNGYLELVDQNVDQASLEDVGVEEEQEDDDDWKHDAHVLDPETDNTNNYINKRRATSDAAQVRYINEVARKFSTLVPNCDSDRDGQLHFSQTGASLASIGN